MLDHTDGSNIYIDIDNYVDDVRVLISSNCKDNFVKKLSRDDLAHGKINKMINLLNGIADYSLIVKKDKNNTYKINMLHSPGPEKVKDNNYKDCSFIHEIKFQKI